MFENFGTAIVQALGFFGVFAFFIYRLLSEKASSNSFKQNSNTNIAKPSKTVNSEKKGLFGRQKKVKKNIELVDKENKKGWFRR